MNKFWRVSGLERNHQLRVEFFLEDLMPEYRWIAIDVHGDECYGVQWAPSPQQLKYDLAKTGLELRALQRVKLALVERLSSIEVLQFFEQLHQLLVAGMLMAPALAVLAQLGSHMRRTIAQEVHAGVLHGLSLAEALALFPRCFGPLVITLIHAGAQAGALSEATGHLCDFLRLRAEFARRIRYALAMPIVTLLFFCTVVLIIFIGIVPSLEHVVHLLNQQPTGSLATIFALSSALTSMSLLHIAGYLFFVLLVLWLLLHIRSTRHIWHWILIRLPIVGSVYVSFVLALFLHAVALLMRGGQSLVASLETASRLIKNDDLRARIEHMQESIAAGDSFPAIFADVLGTHALVACNALLEVGQQTGNLAVVIDQCARLYADRATKIVRHCVLILQPALMAILGVLIAGLMYAVYVPLMQLPLLVQQ